MQKTEIYSLRKTRINDEAATAHYGTVRIGGAHGIDGSVVVCGIRDLESVEMSVFLPHGMGVWWERQE